MPDKNHVVDTRIAGYNRLPSLTDLQEEMPRSKRARDTVFESRRTIESIIEGNDPRILLIHGPCSISDEESAIEYAQRSKEFSRRISDKIFPVMRVYVEKPRTGLGWPGMVVDPNMNGEEDYNQGYKAARRILSRISDIGVACATEYVNNTYTPQLLGEFVSWACIGARTAHSQEHRRMCSGLSSPVGIKNDDKGDISVAINGIEVARQKGLKFLGPHWEDGALSEIKGMGNPYGHIVLRGGTTYVEGGKVFVPNYGEENVRQAKLELMKKSFPQVVMIDCSHDNSGKDYTKQPDVFIDVVGQIYKRDSGIIGIMVESHLKEGKFDLPKDLKGFDRSTIPKGVSPTDGCMSIEATESLALELHSTLVRIHR